ncbi:MAG TPA: ATP-binding cassette domain-containing protein, partial [Thermoanaerobaculia bacterium]|nr:ATP-binding cassette domain-containing protein [Thermoanaerobaculia bacterium]
RIVNDVPPKERDIAMVFQSYALYPHMTVRENLEFGLKMRRVAVAEMRKRVDDAAAILGIAHLLDRRPKELSGGQRQRVAVGRAIVRQPSVFLFDEPLSNLDAKLRVQTRAEITRLQHSLGTTSVYVTHDQIEAMTMGDRITVMKDGKIQQVGTPQQVYEQPANLFVAQFIGTPPMNLLEASVSQAMLKTSSFQLPLPAHMRGGLKEGQQVTIGIRPEHISHTAERLRGQSVEVKSVIDVVEPIGHETVIYALAGSEKLVAIFDPHFTPKSGETIPLFVDADTVHVFDAAGRSVAQNDAGR